MYVKFSALYAGQGAANLIEVYSAKRNVRPLSLILIDLGSAGKAGSPSGRTARNPDEPDRLEAVRYIEEVLGRNQEKLDLLILTHLDEDHINLFPRLTSDGKLTAVSKAIIGGTNSGISDKVHPFRENSRMKKNVTRPVRMLAQALTGVCSNIQIFTADDGYLDTNAVIHEVKGAGGESLTFKLLANRSTPGVKGASEYINSNSSVTVAEYRGAGKHYAVIFPGDATSHTFDFINHRFAAHGDLYTFLQAEKKIMVMPHHAALKTACKGELIKGNEELSEQLSVTREFAEYISPTCVYASAHYRARQYFHPNRDSLELFSAGTEACAVHNVFGFRLRMDDSNPNLPYGGGASKISPRYLMGTELYDKQVYTAHTIEDEIPDHCAYYNGRGAHAVSVYADKNHVFGSLVCEIDGGRITCSYQPIV